MLGTLYTMEFESLKWCISSLNGFGFSLTVEMHTVKGILKCLTFLLRLCFMKSSWPPWLLYLMSIEISSKDRNSNFTFIVALANLPILTQKLYALLPLVLV